jgi:hypothetical protein
MTYLRRRHTRLLVACAGISALISTAIPEAAQAASASAQNPAPAASAPAVAQQAGGVTRTVLGAQQPASSLLPKERSGVVPGEVILGLGSGAAVTGGLVAGTRVAARLPITSDSALNAALKKAGASSLDPLFPATPAAAVQALSRSATAQLGAGTANLSSMYVLHIADQDSTAVAYALAKVAGVAYAEPDVYVNTMDTGGRPLPASVLKAAPKQATAGSPDTGAVHGGTQTSNSAAGDASIPGNYAVADSAQALLNAGGVDAMGAYSILGKDFGQLPGTGEIITNVSVGDLTDESMAEAGDDYVKANGPTTELINGQRYLDLPSMPLIPTYVADPGGGLSGTESVEQEDPSLGEVMLDFGVMSPLPDNLQRAGETGSGYTDLLGIAPGASYRLVVPQQPTYDEIARALMSAAQQTPRPNVITASLGFGTDSAGMPGRYLEDDPMIDAVVAAIVHQYGIVVSISSNDGTRLYTPTAVGPDGGSTPTNLARNAASATNINDDGESTTPSEVPDSGAIAAGGTTLDDTLSAGTAGPATTAETRISGFGVFSSGFGSRVNVSAPSDNVLAFEHPAQGAADSVEVTLNGGTSAAAPEIAAAAAVVLQAARLSGHSLSPLQVRALLERTGRAVPTPAQIDQPLHVGPQVDLTAAVEAVLGRRATAGGVSIARLSVAHHVTVGDLGGEFTETTDPDYIDLGDVASGGDGEGLVGPVTIAGDVVGLPQNGAHVQYTLTDGAKVWTSGDPAIRVTPEQLLAAAGLPTVSTTDRTVSLTYRVLVGGRVAASESHTLTIGPSDGQYVEATAPVAPATVAQGHSVTVSYDLTHVTVLSDPELVVSTAGHWNPALAPIFSAAWSTPLTPGTAGRITIPAGAFDDGGALYGIGILQAPVNGVPAPDYDYGEFAPIRVVGGTAAERPAAPVLTGEGTTGHSQSIDRAQPGFALQYDVRDVPGAASALVEFSAPAPTVYNSFNTFTNANGTQLDHDGVDTAGTAHVALTGTAGTAQLNGLALGLPTSETYDVRVFAVDRAGRIVGQASPISTLEFDDGLTPNGAAVLSFAAAGADSVAALREPDGSTQIVHYDAANGEYGSVIATDSATTSDYEVLGVDAASQRALLVHQSSDTSPTTVETWNLATDKLVAAYTVPTGYEFASGELDAARDRAAVLLRPLSPTSGLSDTVIAVDLADGGTGTPIDADIAGVPADTYTLMAVDQSTGDVYLTTQSGLGECLGGEIPAQVDLDTGVVTDLDATPRCLDGLASVGGQMYALAATLQSLKIVPTSVLIPVDETTGVTGDALTIRRQQPIGMAVDPTQGEALIMYPMAAGTAFFGSQQGFVPDDNATGQLAVVNLKTGETTEIVGGVQGSARGGELMHGGISHLIQLDPATRTGWVIGNGGQQIQQFAY